MQANTCQGKEILLDIKKKQVLILETCVARMPFLSSKVDVKAAHENLESRLAVPSIVTV